MKKAINILLVIVILVSFIALPMNTKAKTIAQFEAEVKKYTEELNAKKANLAKNDEEVAAIKVKISSIEKQMAAAEEEIVTLQKEIDESNEEIARKSEESKKIIEYYQISNGENIYLEYAFGATDITDMIYRMSIVEQLTDYNDKIMKELSELIEKNKTQQQELTKKKEELKKLGVQLESEKARIEADSKSIKATMPSIETQIKEAKAQVTYFKNLGCGANEDIQACQYRISQESGSSLPSVGFFSRPMMKGYVTQGSHSGHIAVDLSSDNKAEPIYAIAEGTVHAIYTDDCTSGRWCAAAGIKCNGNALVVVTKHNYNGRYYYVTYAHMRSYGNIKVGQYITRNTLIAYMGTTGCSTGPHLHMEISTCHWKNNGGCTYSQYQSRFVSPPSLISFPSRWTNR
ncbi:MAG: peptidoglycan DD-metalloendopeptidase family protein [Mycoplasmatota bacterium]|nr:peptidoglycan DD-metalloendopeptidase family protein [Mycoplasmatota bacterium]